MGRRAPRQASGAIRRVRDLAAPRTGLAAVQSAWEEAVGERIAAVTEPVAERGGAIVVECESAVWAQELDLMQAQLLAALAGRLAETAPQRLRFEVRR